MCVYQLVVTVRLLLEILYPDSTSCCISGVHSAEMSLNVLGVGWMVRWDGEICKLLNAMDEEKHSTSDSYKCPRCPPGSGGDIILLRGLKGTCH